MLSEGGGASSQQPQLATLQQMCGSIMICQQQQQPVAWVQQYYRPQTTTVVEQTYPTFTTITQGAPVYQQAITTDPDAAPYGTRGETASAYLAYQKSDKKMTLTYPSAVQENQIVVHQIVQPQPQVTRVVYVQQPKLPAGLGGHVDLYTDTSPLDDEPLHITATVSGIQSPSFALFLGPAVLMLSPRLPLQVSTLSIHRPWHNLTCVVERLRRTIQFVVGSKLKIALDADD